MFSSFMKIFEEYSFCFNEYYKLALSTDEQNNWFKIYLFYNKKEDVALQKELYILNHFFKKHNADDDYEDFLVWEEDVKNNCVAFISKVKWDALHKKSITFTLRRNFL